MCFIVVLVLVFRLMNQFFRTQLQAPVIGQSICWASFFSAKNDFNENIFSPMWKGNARIYSFTLNSMLVHRWHLHVQCSWEIIRQRAKLKFAASGYWHFTHWNEHNHEFLSFSYCETQTENSFGFVSLASLSSAFFDRFFDHLSK